MGLLLAAANQFETAFAAGFQNYFVGDPDFVRPTSQGGGSLFASAQSVEKFEYPICVFECGDAVETVAQTSIYQAEAFIMLGTHLSERPDDYPSLLALHQTRVSKVINLLENVALLKSILNAPATGPDERTVRQFNLYGIGLIDQRNKRANNVLMWVASIKPVAFQPIG
jgi:hypothetical protein